MLAELHQELREFAERHAHDRDGMLTLTGRQLLGAMLPNVPDDLLRRYGADMLWFQYEADLFDGDPDAVRQAVSYRDAAIADAAHLNALAAPVAR